MNTTQIQLVNFGYLDISKEVNIPLVYSLSEIRDLTKRSSTKSKTIILANTINNHKLLSQLYDVNISDTSFNLNKKTPCLLIQNGVVVIDGVLQLLSVNKELLTDSQEYNITYECVILDDAGSFYSTMSEKLLTDLNFYRYTDGTIEQDSTFSKVTKYDYPTTYTTFTNLTWDATWRDGFTFPLMYTTKEVNGISNYNVNDFSPAVFAKVYWDAIFTENGYDYEWDGYEDVHFDKLIIPYNGGKPRVNNNYLNFRAGFSIGLFPPALEFIATTMTNLIKVPYDEVTLDPYFNTCCFSSAQSLYTAPSPFPANFGAKVTYKVELVAPVLCNYISNPLQGSSGLFGPILLGVNFNINLFKSVGTSPPVLTVLATKQILGASVTNGGNLTNQGPSSNFPFVFPALGTLDIFEGVSDEVIASLVPLNTGNRVAVLVNAEFVQTGGHWVDASGNPLPSNQLPFVRVSIGWDIPTSAPPSVVTSGYYLNNYFYQSAGNSIIEDGISNLIPYIPQKVKQKDFIDGIVKLYNLYIYQHPFKEKTLIIKTRDSFYSDSDVKTLDWTEKIDKEEEKTIQFLPELSNKSILLTYTDDNDFPNSQYKDSTNETYGQYQYFFDNDFVTGQKKISPLFSPTPNQRIKSNIIVPFINSQEPKTNLRILFHLGSYYLGNANVGTINKWTYTTQAGTVINFDTYNYAGHLDQPYVFNGGNFDLNYGIPRYLTNNDITGGDYFRTDLQTQYVSNNNLFNNYWRNTIEQIQTGKLLKAKFNLLESDVENIYLGNKIFLFDSYWNINNIEYDANGKSKAIVELISIGDKNKFQPTSFIQPPNGGGGGTGGVGTNQPGNGTNPNQGGNRFGGQNNFITVNGFDNIFNYNASFSTINGTSNEIHGNNSLINGYDNKVFGDNITIFGLSGVTVNDNNKFIIGQPIINYTNLIDAGTDEVLSPFNDIKLVTFIDAGTDEVLGIGSDSIENKIDAGIDNVL